MAFSGATPINCGMTPEYKPVIPSFLMTFFAQSNEFLYSIWPTLELRWFCMRVFTRSMG